MLGRLGLLLGLCLVLARCEDDEVIKCTGGECVKLHLCPNGELNTDGANIIDIRFNPDNECEDYLLKCCPYPEDDDEIVVPPTSTIPGKRPDTVPGTNGGSVPGAKDPGAGPGPGSVPPNPGTSTVLPGDTGKPVTGNKPLGVGIGGGDGKPQGHGQGQGHGYGHGVGGCHGSCSKPDSSSADSDEQTVLVGANQISGVGTIGNQVKEPEKTPPVQGGGPAVTQTGSGPVQPPKVQGTDASETGKKPTGAPTQKPAAAGQKPCQQGVGPTGGASNQNPCQQSAGETGAPGVGGNTAAPKPNQQDVYGTPPTQSNVTGLNAKPGSGNLSGQQQGANGQQNQVPGDVKKPGNNSGVMGTKPADTQDITTHNPLDKTDNVPHKCGLRNVDGVGFRITGDNDGESEYGEFPWMVAILKQEQALDQVINVYQCGGSLIHPSVVLTAAHCVHNRKSEEVKVRLGEWDTQTKNELYDYQDRNVVEIVSHAEFTKANLFNDVALLFLEKPADLMETVNTICLPPANHNFDLSRCFASGWGKDVFGKQGTYQVILKKIELPVMPFNQCQTALRSTRLGRRFKLHKSFICAGGEKGRDTCKGDGGSPLICPIPGTVNHYYQAGMVAWGIGCGEDGIPGVYVNVPMFREWIDEHLRQRNVTDSFYLYS